MQLIFTHVMNLNTSISASQLLGSEGLQETHIGALNPFSSESKTLTLRGGF